MPDEREKIGEIKHALERLVYLLKASPSANDDAYLNRIQVIREGTSINVHYWLLNKVNFLNNEINVTEVIIYVDNKKYTFEQVVDEINE